MIIQAFAFMLMAAVLTTTSLQYLRYIRMRRLYSHEYAKRKLIKDVCRFLPLMPKNSSKRYHNTEVLLRDAGYRISIEGFYLIKTILFVIGFIFFVSVQTTNSFILYKSILSDINMGKSVLDQRAEVNSQKLGLEKDIFLYVDTAMPKGKITLRELKDINKLQMYEEYIEVLIRKKWTGLEEDTHVIAERMYKKLLFVRKLQSNYLIYFSALILAILLYFFPNILTWIRLKLIEDKRDWELLNYIYIFSIFGRLPPYNIKNVLLNMLAISDIYRQLMSGILNALKSGKGEDAFEATLNDIDNEELFELLEVMKLSVGTGLQDLVDNVDEMAASRLKWLDIKSIKRRKVKQVMAMVPVVLIMLLSMIYFSYSLSTLSNPMNFVK